MRGTEYTASSGSTVVLAEAALVDDVIDIVSINPFNIANVYTQTQVDSKVGTNGGMVLVNSTDFTGSSGVNISNVFSSTYRNYRIVINYLQSTSALLNFRFRDGSGDISTSNYTFKNASLSSVSSGVTWTNNFNGRSQNYASVSFSNANTAFVTIDVGNPNISGYKVLQVVDTDDFADTKIGSAGFQSNAVCTGFSLLPASGTITGTVRVYGYRNDV